MSDKDVIRYFDEYDDTLLSVFNTAKSLREKCISLKKENESLKSGYNPKDVISETLHTRMKQSAELLKSIRKECEHF